MITREVIEVFELVQPRCSLRHGVGACEATGRQCYNTYPTCGFKSAFNLDGSIRWRFVKAGTNIGRIYSEPDPNDIRTNPFPALLSVRKDSPSRVNIGASRKGESPIGISAQITATIQDFPFDDYVGDFYVNDRDQVITASFGAKLRARVGEGQSRMRINHYVGYVGQSLDEMQVSRFDVDRITPVSGGQFAITGVDPLRRPTRANAKYPRPTDIRLFAAITDTDTAITVSGLEADISASFGNTNGRRFIRVRDEIIQYTGWSEIVPGRYALTGVARGQLETVAAAHEANDGMQRVARHERQRMYRVAAYIMTDHADMAGLIDMDQWEDEGGTYLSTLQTTATIAEPVEVDKLLGELCRDGLFSIWWDDREQTIPLLAVRPPTGIPPVFTDRGNVKSISLDVRPNDRMTRVVIAYGERSPIGKDSDFGNYRVRSFTIDGEAEGPFYADGSVRPNDFRSRWIRTDANAALVAASLLQRYRISPEYAKLALDAKDRDLGVGDILDLQTSDLIDPFGEALVKRWQVIEWDETVPGHEASVLLQSNQYVGKFAIILPNDALDYEDVLEADRLFGCWMADETTGLMPDGSDPYLLG
jgi:hypothetical protein